MAAGVLDNNTLLETTKHTTAAAAVGVVCDLSTGGENACTHREYQSLVLEARGLRPPYSTDGVPIVFYARIPWRGGWHLQCPRHPQPAARETFRLQITAVVLHCCIDRSTLQHERHGAPHGVAIKLTWSISVTVKATLAPRAGAFHFSGRPTPTRGRR